MKHRTPNHCQKVGAKALAAGHRKLAAACYRLAAKNTAGHARRLRLTTKANELEK